jgi:hypothetical protein
LSDEFDRADKPVLFLEQNANKPLGNRIDRFWAAVQNQSTGGVPYVIVDSGHQVMSGWAAFVAEYRYLVNQELLRPAGAAISTQYERSGNNIDVTARVTNLSGATLSPDNDATLNVLVFERTRVIHTNRFVRAVDDIPVRPALADGATATYNLPLDDVPVEQWGRSEVVVMLDYQPDGPNGKYDMLQAAVAGPALHNPVYLPFGLNRFQ